MYYNLRVAVHETGAKPFVFQWHTTHQSGWAKADYVLYSGGETAGLVGPKVKDGDVRKTQLVDGRATVKLKDLPYEVLIALEKAIGDGMQSMRDDLGKLNAAALKNMPDDA